MKLITYQASDFKKKANNQLKYRPWLSVYKIFEDANIGLNDRNRVITFPINTVVPEKFLIPKFEQSKLSYKECALARASQIVQAHNQTGLPIKIMYSGGIDSSVVLSSFIELLGVDRASKIVTILLNKESLDENPMLWHKFIRPYFAIENSDVNYKLSDLKEWIYVTGELNDQLFGSDIQQDVSNWGGKDFLNLPASVELMSKYLHEGKKLNANEALLWATIFLENLKTCPNHNNQMWDVFWWYNFSWKWIYVYYRIFLYSKLGTQIDSYWLNNYYFPFFDTTQFQLWSLSHNEPKHFGTWASYKYTAKKLVCEILNDNSYMAKVKRQSLKNILYMRMNSYSIDEYEQLVNNQDIVLDEVCNDNNFIDTCAQSLM